MNDPALWLLREAERYLLSLDESAAALQISRPALENLIQKGELTKLVFKGCAFVASYEIDLYKSVKKGITTMIHLDNNPFVGINPYLMSLLQTPGTGATTSLYPSFHSDHITHIKDFLNRYLPRHYIAMTEPSLQIQVKQSEDDVFIKDSSPRPDVAIYQRHPASESLKSAAVPTPTLQLPLKLQEQKTLMAINVYEFKTMESERRGTPVVRIELLSPANMPGSRYDAAYQQNRMKCLLANTALIEIDYLHEYPSPVHGIPLYPQEEDSKPYNIAVTDPRVEKVEVYLFGINETVPVVAIPLAGEERINFDFGQPYDHTWETSRFGMDIDYEQEPLRLSRYSDSDQQIIRQRMLEIQQQVQK